MTAIAAPAAGVRSLPAAGGGVDRAIRVSTAAVVLAVAVIAGYISYYVTSCNQPARAMTQPEEDR